MLVGRWGNDWNEIVHYEMLKKTSVSRNAQYKDIYRRTIEILQCTHILKANCCLKVHNVPLTLASSMSG